MGKTVCSVSDRLRFQKHPHGRGEDGSWMANSRSPKETPPRAWGRHQATDNHQSIDGNTPTGVGKTHGIHGIHTSIEKHPHGRGEDFVIAAFCAGVKETPPRAWGRPRTGTSQYGDWRNTPTGVGKTQQIDDAYGGYQKHPHGRGEDIYPEGQDDTKPETPPRAWGRHKRSDSTRPYWGNTPTGVGKTLDGEYELHEKEKHPHGRGEDQTEVIMLLAEKETPPRAWGRRREF